MRHVTYEQDVVGGIEFPRYPDARGSVTIDTPADAAQAKHAAWCEANRELLDRQSADVLKAFRGERP